MNQRAFILIDVQNGFDDPRWGTRNNPDAEKNIAKLLQAWRNKKWPVIHVRHRSDEPDSPLNPESSGYAFKPETAPLSNEVVFAKSVNSAFIGTNLEKYLRGKGLNGLIIAGLTTDHCVSTTTRMAGNFGFDVELVHDGTATFDRKGINGEMIGAEEMQRVNLASLNGEFCTVVDTSSVLSVVAA
ncbi:cysteine hydrolase family protein [Salinisphaera sp. Q1T1-3]|uniref:cysteine hydrolase family protein n=1 Tax=Salinisphaera sp. Q1T1-3 TaxID=2321229 RepID=UPI000E760FDA|nr:cysteine hydrolase family protein [Salinisphaera sp. Q1T1-3]RJS91990.1 cysteine hydrolase [Salinisphaera sp. Q1T1-3]